MLCASSMRVMLKRLHFIGCPTCGGASPQGFRLPTTRFRFAAALALLLGGTMRTQAAELPLFDAHIHYNHDVWETIPPKEAVARLRQAGVLRALVSSSSDDGTQKLYTEAPDLIVPELRPYRKNGESPVGCTTSRCSAILKNG